MFYLLYITKHIPTSSFYIGRHITTNLNDGYVGSGVDPLLKDKNNLQREIVKFCSSPEELIKEEINLIKKHISNKKCLNKIIGDPTFGVVAHSEKTKEKISNTLKGRVISEEHKEKLSIALKGKPKSEKHKENLSKVRKGKPKSDKFKEAVSKTLKGRLLRPRVSLCQKWLITDLESNSSFVVSDRVAWCKENNINHLSFNATAYKGKPYKNKWLCNKILD